MKDLVHESSAPIKGERKGDNSLLLVNKLQYFKLYGRKGLSKNESATKVS